jgi:hypothetical protein
MQEGKTTISNAESYRKIGEFWDVYDLGEFEDQTYPVSFEMEVRSESRLFAVERSFGDRIVREARKRGVTGETLLNLWIHEKLQETPAVP